ncbi:MAG: hypothetical protein VXZ35_03410 [Pseudomonadota bacterium]|nr:hypothetical protein [Pseudomonadota bacterium]
MDSKSLETEWCVLQNQYDSYEKHSLYIKLASVAVFTTAVVTQSIGLSMVAILLVLWLQDAIWKTFQSRIEPRLLQLEQCIAGDLKAPAFQFNREYQKNRRGLVGLIAEYLQQSVRPTIAFPHAALLLILFALYQY